MRGGQSWQVRNGEEDVHHAQARCRELAEWRGLAARFVDTKQISIAAVRLFRLCVFAIIKKATIIFERIERQPEAEKDEEATCCQ